MTPVDAEQFKVRPTLRILGAVFMLLIAALMVQNAIPFFFAEQVLFPSCAREIKAGSRFLCEVDKAMRSAFPPQMQGPIEALLHLAMAALLIFLSWRLTKPLFGRFGKKPA